ncbi:MAG: preprotein translocase subunit SecE [Anaerolineae bacterium]|nr:preprotein translocase subunit SecE [Anaerolineae bacterium]
MARTATRPADEQEDELIEELAEEAEESASAAPVVSDSRRRRMLKRGETLPEANVSAPVRKDKVATREVSTSDGNFLTRAVRGLTTYFRDTIAELRKVSWPTREETLRLTWIVIIVTVITAIVLGIISFVFSLLTAQVANPDNATLFGIISIGLIAVVAVLWLFRERLPGGGNSSGI